MGELYLVGIGPGDRRFLTAGAEDALQKADLLCGYTLYVDLIREEFPGKEICCTPMTREIERCRYALSRAAGGLRVALVSGGDAGIYGMAGPVLEMAGEYPDVEICIFPGITAATAGAAVLGAPLMNDFAVISLSDRLTPWEMIEKRLRGAAAGDFVICLYNPGSRKRKEHLKKAVQILLEEKSADTLCGYVRNIGREKEQHGLLTLRELSSFEADMFTTVYIGNSRTEAVSGKMIALRGYESKL